MGNAIRVILAVLIILGGQYLADKPELYESFFDAIYERDVAAEDPVVIPLQNEERWLAVVIEFPGDLSEGGSDPTRADSILNGINSVKTYFGDISGGDTNFVADVHQTIHTAKYAISAYGEDDGSRRDAGNSETGGPSGLVDEAFSSTFADIDLSPYDLDDDGWIDRLLILHTGGAQEGSGGSDAIWSHYATLNVAIMVGDVGINQYCMASFDSGMGTMLHEMLHMLGTVDLYDVHSDVPTTEWNGLGDWDIMASGNWNGPSNNGRFPALPTSSTLELMGASTPVDIHIGESGPENQSLFIPPHVPASGVVRIPIAPNEYIWMESRVDTGFDKHLPGHGLLVTQQNLNNGDITTNEVNHDPDFAWVKVIEADGDDGLIRGTDDGDSGDVFTSGKFGAEGVQIRDSHGRLPHWTVEVLNFDSTTGTEVKISSDGLGHAIVMPPASPVRLLEDEFVQVEFSARQSCLPWAQMISSDGRIVELDAPANPLQAGDVASFPLKWTNGASVAGTSGQLEGKMGCGTNNPDTDIIIDWSVVQNRLVVQEFEDEIPVESSTKVILELMFDGNGKSNYDVVIEGPLSRIGTTAAVQYLGNGSRLIIEIDPQGLLAPGMIAEGTVQLYDSNGMAAEFPVKLQAQYADGSAGEVLTWLANPSNNIQLVSFLMALWVISGMRFKREKKKEPTVRIPQPHYSQPVTASYPMQQGPDGPF